MLLSAVILHFPVINGDKFTSMKRHIILHTSVLKGHLTRLGTLGTGRVFDVSQLLTHSANTGPNNHHHDRGMALKMAGKSKSLTLVYRRAGEKLVRSSAKKPASLFSLTSFPWGQSIRWWIWLPLSFGGLPSRGLFRGRRKSVLRSFGSALCGEEKSLWNLGTLENTLVVVW